MDKSLDTYIDQWASATGRMIVFATIPLLIYGTVVGIADYFLGDARNEQAYTDKKDFISSGLFFLYACCFSYLVLDIVCRPYNDQGNSGPPVVSNRGPALDVTPEVRSDTLVPSRDLFTPIQQPTRDDGETELNNATTPKTEFLRGPIIYVGK